MAATWCHERHDYVESRKGLLTAQVSSFFNETVLSSAHLGLSTVAGTETDHGFPPSHTLLAPALIPLQFVRVVFPVLGLSLIHR